MSSANQQNKSLLRNAVNFALLAGITVSFAGACVSSSDNKAAGGASNGGESGTTGGAVSNGGAGGKAGGGAAATGGVAATSTLPECALSTGVVTGNACTPNPMLFTIQDNTAGTSATGTACPIAVWANDGTSSGYFYLPWCNTAAASPADCTLSMACVAGTMHITGSYNGSSATVTGVDGNGGFGMNLQTTFADAGAGCQMISGTGLTGLTVKVTNTTLPANHLLIGLTLANGNAAEYSATLTAGDQTVTVPWSSFKNMKNCGSIPGPGIVGLYFVYDWYNDGAAHNVDMTLGSLGFY